MFDLKEVVMYPPPIDFDSEPDDRYEDDYATDVCDCDRCAAAVPMTA
jgi:hypothetical protein